MRRSRCSSRWSRCGLPSGDDGIGAEKGGGRLPGWLIPGSARCHTAGAEQWSWQPDVGTVDPPSPLSLVILQVRLEDVVLGQYRSRATRGTTLPGYLDDDTVPPNRWVATCLPAGRGGAGRGDWLAGW